MRRLPDDPVSVMGMVVAGGLHVWSLYAVIARLVGDGWPLDSWVRLLPAADSGGPLWLELAPLGFFWLTSAGFYFAARRENGAEAGRRTAAIAMIGNGALWVVTLIVSYVESMFL